jgi:NAD(P)-dependent dehydrogenase (short-subunit alcohol dehydrogenase family)
MIDLRNKTALVTGASRGIGRAAALALAQAGARVIAHYSQSAKEAEALVAEIRAAGGMADTLGADLGTPEGPHMLAAQARNLVGDRLDILVANAGTAKAATIEATTVTDFDRLFAVNVRGPYFLVQQLLPVLGDGSSIVFVSSLAARTSVPGLSAYAATKGAIATIVTHFAAALGGRGIRVNAVAPGVIDTDMSNFARTEEGRATIFSMQVMKRVGQPADVASVVTFLASDDSRWITGGTLPADGGSKL